MKTAYEYEIIAAAVIVGALIFVWTVVMPLVRVAFGTISRAFKF